MIRFFSRAALVALAVLAAPALRADEAPSLLGADDAAKKLGKGAPVLVVFTKEGSDHEKAAKAALADKRLAKALTDGACAVRVDPGDESAAKGFNLSAEKNECTVALDGYGVACGKHDKAPSADAFTKLIRAAQEATTKKKKIEKAIETAVTRAEGALKKDDQATACQQLAPTLEYEKTVPCDAMTKARKLVDELTSKADGLLAKARTATGANNFAEAHKLIAEVNAKYPIPSVQADAKKAREELSQAEAKQSQR